MQSFARKQIALKKCSGRKVSTRNARKKSNYMGKDATAYDEIDAGISGVTASVVARKLRAISRSHQIVCITHLPQIAAAGTSNYRIYKESDDTSTYTHVESLSEDEKTAEIARLLGGENITPTTLASARELIQSMK